MKLTKCKECNKKAVDDLGVCLVCTGLRKEANRAGLIQLLGIFFAIFYWIFRTWIYRGPLFDFSAKTDVILMLGVFPAIGIAFLIYGSVLTISSNKKYEELRFKRS